MADDAQPRAQATLADVTKAVVLHTGREVVIYVEAQVPGAGGRVVISRSPDRALPPGFMIGAVPGNTGINPDAAFTTTMRVASAFPDASQFDEYRVIHAAGTERVKSVVVSMLSGSETLTSQ